MIFDYQDFAANRNFHPKFYHTFYSIDRTVYRNMELKHDKDGKRVSTVLDNIMYRTSKEYFSKIYAAQTEAIGYSENVFPAYKFILPDALMDDWLSVMDPHKKYCRDHSLHQPLTAYIVAKSLGYGNVKKALNLDGKDLLTICSEWLLTSNKTQYLRDYFVSLYPQAGSFPKTILEKMARDVFYEAAVVAALFHDMGYPWQYLNRLTDSIDAADFRIPADSATNAENVLGMISNRLLIYPFYGYSTVSQNRPISTWQAQVLKLFDKSMRNTHGFPGAVGFTYLQDVIRKFPVDYDLNDALFRFALDWAALAVMMHDMPKIYKGKGAKPEYPFLRVSFEKDPLSSLIAMADILEEFHRPAANFNSVTKNGIGVEFDFPCKSTEVTCRQGVMNIHYRYKSGKDVARNVKYRVEEVNDYFNRADGFVDVSPLGITSVVCTVTV